MYWFLDMFGNNNANILYFLEMCYRLGQHLHLTYSLQFFANGARLNAITALSFMMVLTVLINHHVIPALSTDH